MVKSGESGEKSGEVYHQQIRTNHGISWDINGKKLEIFQMI
jgi:hypothetical protein